MAGTSCKRAGSLEHLGTAVLILRMQLAASPGRGRRLRVLRNHQGASWW